MSENYQIKMVTLFLESFNPMRSLRLFQPCQRHGFGFLTDYNPNSTSKCGHKESFEVSIKKYQEMQRNVLIKYVSPVSKISAWRGYRLVARSYDSSYCLNSKLNNKKILSFLRGQQLVATLLGGFNLFFNLNSSTSSVRF